MAPTIMCHAPQALLSMLLGTALTGASVVAQDPGDDPRDHGPGLRFGSSAAIDPFTGERLAEAGYRLPSTTQDESDYSVVSMFTQKYGEYLQQAWGYRPSVRAYYGRQTNFELANEPGDIDFDEYRVESEFQIPIDPDSFLILGGNLGARRYQFDGVVNAPGSPPDQINDESLFEISAKLGYGTFVNDDLLITATFEPGLYSDLDGTMKSEDWRFFGRALATWRAQEGLFLKAGFTIDQTFQDLPIYPTIGASVLFAEGWRFDVLFPEHVQVQWTPDAAWVFSSGLLLQGDVYEMRNNAAAGNPRTGDRSLRTQELRLFVDGVYRLNDNLGIRGRLGGTLAGHYEIDFPTGTNYDGSVEPSVFFELGVDFSF